MAHWVNRNDNESSFDSPAVNWEDGVVGLPLEEDCSADWATESLDSFGGCCAIVSSVFRDMSAKRLFDNRDNFLFLTVAREDPSEERFGIGEDTVTLPSADFDFVNGCFPESWEGFVSSHWVVVEQRGEDLTEDDPGDDELIFSSLGDDFFEGLSHDGDSYVEGISFNFEDRSPLILLHCLDENKRCCQTFQGFCHSSQREVWHSLFQCDLLRTTTSTLVANITSIGSGVARRSILWSLDPLTIGKEVCTRLPQLR